MRKVVLILMVSFLALNSFGQDRKIDKLEILYDQGYYKSVLRKARKLQANPEFDYSALPDFYEAMAIFKLSADDYWFKRHKEQLDVAIESFVEFLDHKNSKDYLNQHYNEMAEMKIHLQNLWTHFHDKGWKASAEKVRDFVNEELKHIDEKPLLVEPEDHEIEANDPPVQLGDRDKMVKYAKKYIGVKYKWAGSDAKGFDCSGYTSFIHKKFGIVIARTAGGQKDEAKKVKLAKAQKGDLLFFGPGAKISHVGMVVSEQGEDLQMIHASSSKGVIITNVTNSKYWSPKLKGAGTYLKS